MPNRRISFYSGRKWVTRRASADRRPCLRPLLPSWRLIHPLPYFLSTLWVRFWELFTLPGTTFPVTGNFLRHFPSSVPDEQAIRALREREHAEREARAPPIVTGLSPYTHVRPNKVRDAAVAAASAKCSQRRFAVGAAPVLDSSGAPAVSNAGGLLNKIRKLVSKKKHRFVDDMFDLDLTCTHLRAATRCH